MYEDQYPWIEIYRAALLEVDPAKLQALVADAENHSAEVAGLQMEATAAPAERQALSDALQSLRVIRR